MGGLESGMFQALPPDLLAHILRLALGPDVETYVGGGRHASGVPLLLGTDSRGLCGLRLVCKAFRDVLREIPLHVSVSTARHVRILAALPFRGWNIAAVQLNLAAEAKPDLQMYAARTLPDEKRRKIVTVDMSGLSTGFYARWSPQRQLEGVSHMIIRRTTATSLDSLDRLSYIERLELLDVSVYDQTLLALLPTLPSLHSLHINRLERRDTKYCWLPFDVVAQCPSLRVLELGNYISLTSPGTSEEALEDFEKSRLDTLKVYYAEGTHRVIWKVQPYPTSLGAWSIVRSAWLGKHFSCILEESQAGADDGKRLVLRRRCVKDSIRQEIAACKGGSLVLGGDLSRQLVLSPELQALVREAGLPVELHFDHFCMDLQAHDWLRLDVPVLSWHWHAEHPGSWCFLLHSAWPCRGVAAIHGLTIPCEEEGSGIVAREFAASFCNLRTISTRGQGRMMEALPKSCERVEMRWTGLDSMGQAAGLGAYPNITRLSLQGFRVTELPPGVEHLDLQTCNVEGLALPAEGLALRSLRLQSCNPGHRGATFAQQSGRAHIDLLGWLAAAQPQAAVRVSDAQLTLGTLSMERYAKQLSEVAPRSVTIDACTLHRRDGCLSMHSVADMARYLGRHFGRRVAVTGLASKNSCQLVRVDEGQ